MSICVSKYPKSKIYIYSPRNILLHTEDARKKFRFWLIIVSVKTRTACRWEALQARKMLHFDPFTVKKFIWFGLSRVSGNINCLRPCIWPNGQGPMVLDFLACKYHVLSIILFSPLWIWIPLILNPLSLSGNAVEESRSRLTGSNHAQGCARHRHHALRFLHVPVSVDNG